MKLKSGFLDEPISGLDEITKKYHFEVNKRTSY